MGDGGAALRKAFGGGISIDPAYWGKTTKPSTTKAAPLKPETREATRRTRALSAPAPVDLPAPKGLPSWTSQPASWSPSSLTPTGSNPSAEKAKRDEITPKRNVTHPDNSANRVRAAAIWNKEMRRQLTDEEWSGLSGEQQQSVRFNAKLLDAYDLDQTESPKDRRNAKNLISQLGLSDDVETGMLKGMGNGVGLAVREKELFGATPNSGVLAPGAPRSPLLAPQTATGATSDRQKQINQIAEKLGAFLTSTAPADSQASLATALARKDEYKFENPYAKETFELSFDQLLDPNYGLASIDWPTAAAGLAEVGLSPDEFKDYMRDRVQLLPNISGQLNLEALDSWFGK